ERRKEYDEVRRLVASGVGPGGAGFPGGFRFEAGDFGDAGGLGDMLGNLIGGGGGRGRRGRGGAGPRRGADLETELELSFLDAINGVTTSVDLTAQAQCSVCGGSGAKPGTAPDICSRCGGTGSIAVDQGPFSFSQVCPVCGGRG